MTKTSQQITEETINKLTSSMFPIPPNIDPYLIMRERDYFAAEVLQAIPLAQLIEVARAAEKWSHSLTEDETDQNEHELCIALNALKQTGKAEWL